MAYFASSRESLCGEWDFHLGEAKIRPETSVNNPCYYTTKAGGWLGVDDFFMRKNAWKPVTVPHDWCTALNNDPSADPNNGYKARGTAWYTRAFSVSDADFGRAILEFEGVMSDCTVYVNGTLAGRNHSGYNGFFIDITDLVLPGGENRLAVRADTTRWEGWWYEGAGIYRPVWLHLLPNAHIEPQGIFTYAARDEDGWRAHVACDITCVPDAGAVPLTLFLSVSDATGRALSRFEQCVTAKGGQTTRISAALPLDRPPLWSPDAPNLLTLTARLTGADCKDARKLTFGAREIEWSDRDGLIINGVPTRVKGVCCHQDHAGVGIAVPEALDEYRVKKLKDMGANAYRCAHHCASQSLLGACDRLGLLVLAENRHFTMAEETLYQLDQMVLSSRNHPCVFAYSAFNEEFWAREKRGYLLTKRLARRIRALDPTRKITGAIHTDGASLTEINASDAMDITGINYSLCDWEAAYARIPGRAILGTENSPTYATRGVCRTDREKQIFDAGGMSAFGPENELTLTMEKFFALPYMAGVFAWSGFDYRGEPAPYQWPSVRSHWGFADACGAYKDTAYLLKAYYSDEPVLRLLPHWNHAEGREVRVRAFTNLTRVTLYVNGEYMGEKPVSNRQAEWTAVFKPGAITAIGYDEKGNSYTAEVRTAATAASIGFEVSGDEKTAVVDMTALDGSGVLVPDFSGTVALAVQNGELIGAGNGDPNDLTPDNADIISFFNGRAQAIVRRRFDAALTARCEALAGKEKLFSVQL